MKIKKIVLITGCKTHGPEDNGIHDYPSDAKLLKVMLDNSNVADQVKVKCCPDGWPADQSILEDTDSIVIISDGRDGHIGSEALHLETPARLAFVDRLMKRGCGIAVIHFAVFAPHEAEKYVFDWYGGYYDWGTDQERKWYSAIKNIETDVQLASPEHPILRGVKPFRMQEEFYYNLRFSPSDKALKPLWVVPGLAGREPDGNIVAWARERKDGGRGFATSCGHFHENFRLDDYRTMFLNAIFWTAGLEVPASGVMVSFYDRDAVSMALADVKDTERAVIKNAKTRIRVLMIDGNDEHKWHNWDTTSPLIKSLLEQDARIRLDVTQNIEDLTRLNHGKYDVLALNYCNWKDPRQLSDASKKALTGWLNNGGGLLVIHFANGAFHYSLPEAGASDWPEYRRIVRRVWNHDAARGKKSAHDSFGSFAVSVCMGNHPIARGLNPFQVEDELYFDQDGADPIEPIISARSTSTGKDEPMAWTYAYGKGRVFQTLLGHSAKTYEAWEAGEMLRRAAAWVARKEVHENTSKS